MTYRAPQIMITLACVVIVTGCQPQRPAYRFDRGDLNYYVDQATDIAYPDLAAPMLEEVTHSLPPITNRDAQLDSFWDLTLEDSVAIALQNSKVIRGYGTPGLQGTRVAPGVDNLANGPRGAGSIYDVAIRETEPGIIGTPGQISPAASIPTNTGLDTNQGVEAALADFDAQLTSNLSWQRSDQPRNVAGTGLIFTPSFFEQDAVVWTTQVGKKTANGTQLFARNVSSYTANTIPSSVQPLASVYQTAIEFEVRQPLLRGRGAFINRMPVVISRINTDQAIANFESVMQNMVTNVEIRYWDLHCAYRNLETAMAGRDAALATHRNVKQQFLAEKVPVQDEAQARGQYYFFRSQVEQAWADLLIAETNFRWLLGVASTDGKLIRPINEPTKARVNFDYCQTMDEALTYRPELRQERWEVKKKELALAQSKNSLLPSMNVSALYRWLGLGDRYVNHDDSVPPFPNTGSGALNDLFNGDYTELEFNIDFGMPIGFRRELSNVRNAQLKIALELARLEDMELDVAREITQALQALEANYQLAVTSFNSWSSYTEELEAREERYKAGTDAITFLLDAQRSRAQGEANYFQAICEYNKLIALIHRRKGTIMSYNNISVAEGPWPNKAYDDASENARRRGASREINFGFTRPQVISLGSMYPANGGEFIDETLDGVFYDQEGQVPFDFPEQPNLTQPVEELLPTPTPAQPRSNTLPNPPNNAAKVPSGTSIFRDRGVRTAVVHPVEPPAAAATSSDVDWTRFGMSRQDVNSQTTRAVIRQVNYEEAIEK